MAPQQAPAGLRARLVGVGGGQVADLGQADTVPEADYSRAGIDIPGVGKGYYSKDGRYAILDGGKTVAMLGYDPAGSARLNEGALKRRQAEANISKTYEEIASSQDKRNDPNKGIPAGYTRGQDGRVVPIPGGPADLKRQEEYVAQKAALQSVTSEMDKLEASTMQVLNHPGLSRITGVMGSLPDYPGGQAANADALLFTLKSQIGFSVLQAMRNASKTGGALGNISDNEGKRLEANLASLEKSQSLPQFKEQLGRILTNVRRAKERTYEAFTNSAKMNGFEPAQNDAYPAGQSAPQEQQKSYPAPNARAVQMAKSDPGLAQQFLQTFGPQWAAKYGVR